MPQNKKVDPADDGGLSNHYLVHVAKPQREEQAPYTAECEDIIVALKMTFDEGNLFKELWRTCNERNGAGKPNNSNARAANKVRHYARRTAQNWEDQ